MGLSLGALALGTRSAYAAVTIEAFSAEAANTAAGEHADATTSFSFKTIYGSQQPTPLGGDANDVIVKLPPGVVGDLQNVPRCPRALFDLSVIQALGGGCPANTQVGIATVNIGIEILGGVSEQQLGVFNIQPGPNEPAMLGVEGTVSAVGVVQPILIEANAADNYTVTATAQEIHETPLLAKLLGSTVTLWGVPGAHERADGSSNWGPGQPTLHNTIPAEPAAAWKPLMENPTSCASTPLTTLSVNTYQEPEVFTTATAASPIPTDCAAVPFAPTIKAEPDTTQAGAPTGLHFELTVPQTNDPSEPGTAELEKAVVTLPAGMTISPSAASTLLEACTDQQFAHGSNEPADCPAASVIGEDEVESPLVLAGPLKGKVYLGQPLSTDPTSGQMFRVFQELHGYGLDVKVAGSVIANPETGQLTATFAGLPELPFQTFRLHFRGGPNAVLANPTTCSADTITTQLYPYSNPAAPATPSSTFTTTYDGHGAACPPTLPFNPAASIATSDTQAGALAPLTVTFARADETQPLGQLTATLPAGLLGYVSKVALCQAAKALAGTCPPESRIGTVSTTAGAGADPLTVEGSVYLARGSDGYPFVLSVVVPAIAGPYDLGNVVVPVWLQVNSNASLTAVSGPLPSILDGIPLDIRSVTTTIDRPGIVVNPTSCAPLALTGTADSLSGELADLTAPFQATGCAALPFNPTFEADTEGSGSIRNNGASLTVRLTQQPGEANIKEAKVALPKALPARLHTLQHACTAAQFDADPAGCPREAIVGTAEAITPLLDAPFTGPAILVSHGGAAFPDLELVLQAEGVTILLNGSTNISNGITTSDFKTAPDAPISAFELKLPEGPYSALSANTLLCSHRLEMPTLLVGQNGVRRTQTTLIGVTGCQPPKPTVRIAKAALHGARLLVTVGASSPGVLTLSAPDATPVRRAEHAGRYQLTLRLGARFVRRHTITVRAHLSAGKQSATTTKTLKV